MKEAPLAGQSPRKPADIFLVRHGEPDVDWTPSIDMKTFGGWARAYDAARLRHASRPPADVLDLTATASRLFCSMLPRSHQSCMLAAGETRDAECSPLFNEVRLVMPPFAPVRLRPSRWVTLSGILWRLGYSRGVEPRSAVRSRAKAAVDLLIETAQDEQSPIVLFGHGAMNRFLRDALRSRGWRSARSCSDAGGYWGWSCHVESAGAAS